MSKLNKLILIILFTLLPLQLIANTANPAMVPIIAYLLSDSTPVANAGADQNVYLGDTVELNGSQSSGANSYLWSFLSMPEGSSATFSDASIVNPTFDADEEGVYEILLIVNGELIDTVMITSSASVANAGADQNVNVGDTVELDSSESDGADSYLWNFLSVPLGSEAIFSDSTDPFPTFIADQAGVYESLLIINGEITDTIIVTASNFNGFETLTNGIYNPATTIFYNLTMPSDGNMDIDVSSSGISVTFYDTDMNVVHADANYDATRALTAGDYIVKIETGSSSYYYGTN